MKLLSLAALCLLTFNIYAFDFSYDAGDVKEYLGFDSNSPVTVTWVRDKSQLKKLEGYSFIECGENDKEYLEDIMSSRSARAFLVDEGTDFLMLFATTGYLEDMKVCKFVSRSEWINTIEID